jgi:hypothetical protein
MTVTIEEKEMLCGRELKRPQDGQGQESEELRDSCTIPLSQEQINHLYP